MGHPRATKLSLYRLTSGVSYDTSQSVAVLLRQWREQRGYSVRELARRAGVGYVTVVRIENDQISPTVAMLEKLAKALGISVRDFFPPGRHLRRPGKRGHT
jgi:transcriptional regulator with XRE-family HTH domain